MSTALDEDRVHIGKVRDASSSLVLGAFTWAFVFVQVRRSVSPYCKPAQSVDPLGIHEKRGPPAQRCEADPRPLGSVPAVEWRFFTNTQKSVKTALK